MDKPLYVLVRVNDPKPLQKELQRHLSESACQEDLGATVASLVTTSMGLDAGKQSDNYQVISASIADCVLEVVCDCWGIDPEAANYSEKANEGMKEAMGDINTGALVALHHAIGGEEVISPDELLDNLVSVHHLGESNVLVVGLKRS